MMILKGEWTANLYKMKESIIIGDASAATEKEDTSKLWHMRLGHMSEQDLQVLHKKGALPGIKYCKLDLCKFCIMSRHRKVAFSISQHKTKGLLDLIHMDMWGLSPVASIRSAKYYVTFIDDFSKRVWVHFLNQKSKVFQKYKEWKTMVRNQKEWKVKVLRSDNGGKYTSTEFKAYLAGKGIEHQLNISGWSEQNGVVERINGILSECARSIWLQADMSEGFWAETVNHASYLVNRSPSTVVDLQIPEEI